MSFPSSHLDPFDTVWYTPLLTFDITLALNIRIQFSKDIVFLIGNTCDIMKSFLESYITNKSATNQK